jgi:hypothetical protein
VIGDWPVTRKNLDSPVTDQSPLNKFQQAALIRNFEYDALHGPSGNQD